MNTLNLAVELDAGALAGGCCATAMRKASRRVTQLYDSALAQSGLRSTQFAILSQLEQRGKHPPTLQELAHAMVMDRSALGHNLRPLERDGLVALQESHEDRRRRHVVITAQGKTLFRQARKYWKQAQDRFLAVYGEANAEQLRTALLAIAHNERLGALCD
jgi:DNA-binding MarR family transcriptional regulator